MSKIKRKPSWEISCFGWDGIMGVYCVCSIENGKTIIHYIGSSKNIGKRVNKQEHPYRKLYNEFPVFIKYKETENFVELEKKLIRRLKPKLNITLYQNG